MLMPALERDGVDRVRLAREAGERGARVREGVDADAEPRDAVAAGDADQAEEQDDRDLHRGEVLQHAEVEDHDHADEQLEEQDELALRDQVGLARFVDQLGDLVHRSMHRQVAQLHEDDHAEDQSEQRHEQADDQQRAAVDTLEVDLTRGRAGSGSLHPPRAAPVSVARPAPAPAHRAARWRTSTAAPPANPPDTPNANATYAAFVSSETADANRRIVP